MSGHPKHAIEFSLVKETVEAQSGRFEFLKQALTLGSAGIAGFSIFFTEPDKLPESFGIRFIIFLGGLGLLVVTGAALSGIGSYANLLRRIEKEENARITGVSIPADEPQQDSNFYRKDTVRHATICLWGLFISALILVVFAGLRIFLPSGEAGPEQALNHARAIVKNQIAAPSQTYTLEGFSTDPDGYSAIFYLDPNHMRYLIKLKPGGKFEISKP